MTLTQLTGFYMTANMVFNELNTLFLPMENAL